MSAEVPLDEILVKMTQLGASDLHLGVGSPPIIRIDGVLRAFPGFSEVLTSESLRELASVMLPENGVEKFRSQLELDFAYSVSGGSRFRVNLFQQRGNLGAALRRIDEEVKSFESLGVPDSLRDFAYLQRGLVLVTGPTGSGKSTTLNAIIDVINRERACHVMTVEDPVEFVHTPKRSIVNQREVGSDTKSFHSALKHVLRQDPDVILIGELRDIESMSAALTAAETGHLVFATLHTMSTAQTVERIIDVFPPHQQQQVRTQLSSTLRGVLTQTLIPRKAGGQTVATELLRGTDAVRRLIREGETHQIYSALQAGSKHGMHTLDQSLVELVRKGEIDADEARDFAVNLATYDLLSGQTSAIDQFPEDQMMSDLARAADDNLQ